MSEKELFQAIQNPFGMQLKKQKTLTHIHCQMFYLKTTANKNEHATTFAKFFSNKGNTIVSQILIDPDVYNGNPKANLPNKFFYDKYRYP